MNAFRTVSASLLLIAAGAPAWSIPVTLDVNFEDPFSVGPVAGQYGWGESGSISTAQAHSGTQSLQTSLVVNLNFGTALKALDATGGEYPFGASNFSFGQYTDWWVQGWVRVVSGGGGARMGLVSGPCPYVQVSGSGTPTIEPCIAGEPPVSFPSEGADVLDQWILMRMVHTTSMTTNVEISILGDNVNFSTTLGYAGPPGVSTASYITLSGDAYWDDISAGYGQAPAIVPAPAAGWLLMTAFGTLLTRTLRRRA